MDSIITGLQCEISGVEGTRACVLRTVRLFLQLGGWFTEDLAVCSGSIRQVFSVVRYMLQCWRDNPIHLLCGITQSETNSISSLQVSIYLQWIYQYSWLKRSFRSAIHTTQALVWMHWSNFHVAGSHVPVNNGVGWTECKFGQFISLRRSRSFLSFGSSVAFPCHWIGVCVKICSFRTRFDALISVFLSAGFVDCVFPKDTAWRWCLMLD